MNILILCSIFLVPLSTIIPLKNSIVWYPQFLTLLSTGFLLLSLELWKFNKAISLFTIYLLYSYIFVCDQNARSMLCLASGYAGCYIAYFSSKFKSSATAIKCISVMVFLQFILVILQCFHRDPFFSSLNGDFYNGIVGFLGSHNQLAIYSATVAVLVSPFLIITAIVPLVLVKTSSALFALFTGGLLYTFLRYSKKIVTIVIILCALSSIIWFKYDNNVLSAFQERFEIWKLTVTQITQGEMLVTVSDGIKKRLHCNPLTGYGLGSFMVISPPSQNELLKNVNHRYEHVHNDLLEVWFEFGYIGLSILLFCIYTVIRDFVKYYKNSRNNLIKLFTALFVMSVCSLGVYVFHAPTTYFMFMLILGLFYSEVNYTKEDKKWTQKKRR